MMNTRKHSDEDNVNGQTSASSATGSNLGTSTAIGRRLKAYYDDVASEPVPDRFLSLLNALDAAETKRSPRD